MPQLKQTAKQVIKELERSLALMLEDESVSKSHNKVREDSEGTEMDDFWNERVEAAASRRAARSDESSAADEPDEEV